jgi:hypothetical protein
MTYTHASHYHYHVLCLGELVGLGEGAVLEGLGPGKLLLQRLLLATTYHEAEKGQGGEWRGVSDSQHRSGFINTKKGGSTDKTHGEIDLRKGVFEMPITYNMLIH